MYARRTFVYNKSTETATGQLIGSSILLLPVAFVSYSNRIPPIEIILAVTTLAIVCTAFAYMLYFQLISSIGPTRTATVTFLIPIFSLLFGKVLLGEPVNSGLIVGLITILLSVWLVIEAKL